MSQLPHNQVSAQFTEAFRSVQFAKTVLVLLIALALLAQVGAFVLVSFVGVTRAAEPVTVAAPAAAQAATEPQPVAEPPATDEAPPPAAALAQGETLPPDDQEPAAAEAPAEQAEPAPDRVGSAVLWKSCLDGCLEATMGLTPIGAAMLLLVLLLAVQFSLLGRLGGADGLTSAMLWSVFLMVLVTPWQEVLPGKFAIGATYSLRDLLNHSRHLESASGAGLLEQMHYYLRFLAVPVLALLVLLAVALKFSRGRGDMALPIAITAVPTPVDPPARQEPQEPPQS